MRIHGAVEGINWKRQMIFAVVLFGFRKFFFSLCLPIQPEGKGKGDGAK
jgi:hypothetical protein